MECKFLVDNSKGFGLVEVMIAIMVFGLGAVATVNMLTRSTLANMEANRISATTSLAASRIDTLLRKGVADPLLVDTDGDGGTGSNSLFTDANSNGLIDYGEDLGLYDRECCPNGLDPVGTPVAGCVEMADQCMLFDEYALYWNVAINSPVPGIRTIRVIAVPSSNFNATFTAPQRVLLPMGNGMRRASYRNSTIITNVYTSL